MKFALTVGAAAAALISQNALAQTEEKQDARKPEVVLEAVTVVGTADEANQLGSSNTVIDADTLQRSRVFTTAEALRKAPGVNVRDEEGMGLRPNIGIRGLNPTRSTKVLLLEDGLPLAYAPYGDNASYYHPPVERFDRIEVLKGAAMNLYGPQTLGGVINYITPVPPQEFSGRASVAGGSRDYFNGHLRLGGAGMMLDYMRKQGDGARDNLYSQLNDVNYKAVFDLAAGHQLIARASYYTEDSQLTYSGLTDAEYRNFGPRYNPFDNDSFQTNRTGTSLSHQWTVSPTASLTTHAYWSDFSRDWWRQSSSTTETQCGTAFRDARLAGQRVDPDSCASNQGRLRDYYTYGLEPRLKLAHGLFGLDNELQTGVRAHFEKQDRRQINGSAPEARGGNTVENNERFTDAYSAFVQNRFGFGKLSVTPSVRIEDIHFERVNRLNGVRGKEDLTEILGALSLNYQAAENLSVFAGIHQGFAPPRTEDLIAANGTSVDLGAEESVNYELGLRARPLTGVAVEVTAFRSDFGRQIAVGSIAGGSTPLATGETVYQGAELSGRVELGRAFGWTQHPYVEVAYTVLPTAKSQSALRRVDNGQVASGSAAGNRLPYAPRHLFTGTLGYLHAAGFDARVEGVFIDEQYSDFANTEDPNGTGQVGKIASSFIWNAAVNYQVPQVPGLGLFIAGKNLADRDYIVDRTRGIQTGIPRLVQGGVEYSF